MNLKYKVAISMDKNDYDCQSMYDKSQISQWLMDNVGPGHISAILDNSVEPHWSSAPVEYTGFKITKVYSFMRQNDAALFALVWS